MDEKQKEWLVLLAVIAGVFAITYFGLRSFLAPDYVLINGLRVHSSGDAAEAIRAVLSPQEIAVRGVVQDANDAIPGQAVVMTEVSSAISSMGKNVTVLGYIANRDACVDANRTEVNCLKPHVVVKSGGCNCLAVSDGKLEIIGTDEWFLANAARMRGVIRGVLKAQNGTE